MIQTSKSQLVDVEATRAKDCTVIRDMWRGNDGTIFAIEEYRDIRRMVISNPRRDIIHFETTNHVLMDISVPLEVEMAKFSRNGSELSHVMRGIHVPRQFSKIDQLVAGPWGVTINDQSQELDYVVTVDSERDAMALRLAL